MKKIAVMGGTLFDTALGVNILKTRGYATIALPLCQNPKEQSHMQMLKKEELTNLAIEKIKPHRDEIFGVFVYCNSFSAASDIDRIRRELNIKVVTPLDQYKKYAKAHQRLLIWAANAQSAAKIESILEENNPGIDMISLSFLPLVEAIEEDLGFSNIDNRLKLKALLNVFMQMEIAGKKIDTLLLGCTHFPYLIDGLKEIKGLKLLDPAEDMIKELLE
ncbi:MAG: racemase [Tissierellia bacterium]|nr:racemase [Tissierellia bacterium]